MWWNGECRCASLGLSALDDKKPVKHIFSGKRYKRGLYRSKDGLVVHADLNGAANIAVKAGREGAILVSGGVVTTPILVGL
jgi:putative transposase